MDDPPPYHSISHSALRLLLTSSLQDEVNLTTNCSVTNNQMSPNQNSILSSPDDSYPFPSKVSPSDIEIGIVTPGSERSERSSKSGQEVKETFLELLPVDDVIIASILPLIPLQSLFALRVTCTRARDIINSYFRVNWTIDLTLYGSKFSPLPFHVMVREARKLRKLLLRNAKQWLTDELLIPVIKRNLQLEEVDFSACSTISNKSIHILAVTCGPKLKKLDLRDCHWLSCDAVLDLAIKCKNLCHVDLAGCWDINDDAIITLISTNCNIQFLSLAKIYGITDKTVIQIAHRCRMLENLNLHGCWRITNDAVKALGDYCPSLRVLSIRENSNVTEFSLGPLRNRRIQVDVPPPPTGIRGLNLINPLFQQAMPQNFANMPPPNFMVIGDVAFQNHMNRM